MILKEASWEGFYQSYWPSRLKEVLVFSFGRLRLPYLLAPSSFFFFLMEDASFCMLLMEWRLLLNGIWLSPFTMSHNYPSFAIILNMFFFILGVRGHDFLLESNKYRFESPKLNQAFSLIIKLCWWWTLEVISTATWFVWATSSISSSIFFSRANFRINFFNTKHFSTGWLITRYTCSS